MASSAPPILPISNQSVASAESQPPIATPAFHALISHINKIVRNGLSQRRPWSELFDRTAFSKPESISDATDVIFLTSVGSVLISALLIGLAFVCTHGAFRAPKDLFLDEQELASMGFLSFLGGAAPNVASAAAPVVVGRVYKVLDLGFSGGN